MEFLPAGYDVDGYDYGECAEPGCCGTGEAYQEPQVSRDDAEYVLSGVKGMYKAELWGEPKLFEPGEQSSGWAIVWEEGPEGWNYGLSGTIDIPPGVFVERINHYSVGLYLANG